MSSNYQIFKLALMSVLPLTKDAIHVYIGFLCLLVALIVLRRKITSFWALAPGVVVSLAMEAFDLRDGFTLAESAKDLVNTNLIPLLLVLLARWGALRH
ncbi:MAG TPA: hypothetical protein VEG34_00380 [Thermoanaerobaculia bacterium]|nr:hypothetical protein [Thermoanaerobaculia bacterium]